MRRTPRIDLGLEGFHNRHSNGSCVGTYVASAPISSLIETPTGFYGELGTGQSPTTYLDRSIQYTGPVYSAPQHPTGRTGAPGDNCGALQRAHSMHHIFLVHPSHVRQR